jgi:hypothetical protein
MHDTTGPNWTVTGLAAGSYTATLTYTDTFTINGASQTCTGIATPFTFTVYTLPTVTAMLDTSGIDCDPYNVTLTATGTSGFTNYSWSNGAVTQSTQVTAGGDYRVWLTGPGNCIAHSDILVPHDPELLIQYVPYGCYTYNCDALDSPGITLDGPPNTAFNKWSWNSSGSPISGHTGVNSDVSPYTVTHAGDYSLSISNGLDSAAGKCSSTSPIMHVSVSPIPCHEHCPGLNPSFVVDSDCTGAGQYTIDITDTNTIGGGIGYTLTSSSGTFTGVSPSTLTLGTDHIHSTFTANAGVTGPVLIVITLVSSTGSICQDTVTIIIPNCAKMLRIPAPDDSVPAPEFKMLLMPNPASGNVNVVYSTGATNDSITGGELLTLSLSDMSGQQIEQQPLATISGLVTIDASILAPGVYYVTLRKDHVPLITDKLVVLAH